jgi:hypothetical protein
MSELSDSLCVSAATDGALKRAKAAIDQRRLRSGR